MKMRDRLFADDSLGFKEQTAREKRRQAERQKRKGTKVKPDQPQPRGFSK